LNHEFVTGFVAMGPIADGTLAGHLRVVGDGDPSFGLRDYGETLGVFRHVAARLKELGVSKVTGDVLCDDAAFDQEFTGPDWPKSLPTTTLPSRRSRRSPWTKGFARLRR
jgi:D-alanyl-D-alanine carboxypeptidase